MMTNAREMCARVLNEVIRLNKHLDLALAVDSNGLTDTREKRLTQELCYGVMRWFHQLIFITNILINKPLKKKDTDILALILSGLYQIKFLRIPDHASISASVDAANSLNKPWAKDLINAVLRRYQRECELINNKINESMVARNSHPEWIIKKLKLQWPDYWQGILSANNKHPPLHIRLNQTKTLAQQYIDELEKQGIEYTTSKMVDMGISISNPVNVDKLPGFSLGNVSIQDFGAQLAAPLLECQPGQRVLDACAAPGGKTGHILELERNLSDVIAVELDENRTPLLQDTLNRLSLKATIIQDDVINTDNWWDGNPFDRILLDAPCSAIGVIRRHPDIKYLRKSEQLSHFASSQNKMLNALWPLLKPGGRLVYCVCSIFYEETDEQIAAFSSQYKDARIVPIYADWGVMSEFGRHTIPGHDESDGFYYSVIAKLS